MLNMDDNKGKALAAALAQIEKQSFCTGTCPFGAFQ